MNDRLTLVSRSRDEADMASLRVAVIERGVMTDYFSYKNSPEGSGLRGAIYKGAIVRVVDETQSCYIDLGLQKNAVLYAKDAAYTAFGAAPRPVGTLFSRGNTVLVQIERDADGRKGPRATAKISIAGAYAALLPGCPYPVSVSTKIRERDMRIALKAAAQEALPDQGFSAIVRTRAKDADNAALKDEITNLLDEWNAVAANAKAAKPPALIRGAKSPLEEIIETAQKNNAAIIADNNADYEALSELASRSARRTRQAQSRLRENPGDWATGRATERPFEPTRGRPTVSQYNEPYPIFAFYGVADEVASVCRRTVRLKSGAEIVVDRAEALTAIDVNFASAKAPGNSGDSGDAVLRVNAEAVVEAARQLRFRDVGGIVMIDVIRMKNPSDYDAVIKALKAELSLDRKRATVAGVTKLGLIELSRAYV